MNNIYFQDFGSIDYIRWNLVPLKPDQIYKAASYFNPIKKIEITPKVDKKLGLTDGIYMKWFLF